MINHVGDDCCGCEACMCVCPKHAISFEEKKDGFHYPNIHNDLCINCGLCENVCPVLNSTESLDRDIDRCFVGHSNNENILKITASGGIGYVIAEHYINSNGCAVGVVYSKGYNECQHLICKSESEIRDIAGTKYIQSRKKDIYPQVKALLEEGKKLVYFGTPCEIYALKKYLHINYENLLTCDLICHGPTSHKAQEQYIKYIESKYNSKCIYFNPKDNNVKGWDNSYLTVALDNNKIISRKIYWTEIGDALENMPRKSCLRCKFKGNRRLSDLTIGDYWGCDRDDLVYNDNGVSLIIPHTIKGRTLILKLNDISIKEVNIDEALKHNPMYYHSCSIRSYKSKFRELFEEQGLIYATKKTNSLLRKAYLKFRIITDF